MENYWIYSIDFINHLFLFAVWCGAFDRLFNQSTVPHQELDFVGDGYIEITVSVHWPHSTRTGKQLIFILQLIICVIMHALLFVYSLVHFLEYVCYSINQCSSTLDKAPTENATTAVRRNDWSRGKGNKPTIVLIWEPHSSTQAHNGWLATARYHHHQWQ